MGVGGMGQSGRGVSRKRKDGPRRGGGYLWPKTIEKRQGEIAKQKKIVQKELRRKDRGQQYTINK